ncbi:MAG: thioredoxin family protein [Phycisphaerales bacterium]
MPAASSTMVPLGANAPSFSLPNTNPDFGGSSVSLDDLTGNALVVMFLCNHCPFVKHIRDQLAALGRDYAGRGVSIVAISSNNVQTHPADAPDKMTQEARDAGYTFPYLYDETQEVARAYRAACTPDFYVFDRDRQLVYRGQLDDSRPSLPLPVTGKDLRTAIDRALAAKPPLEIQKPSIGCNIKWKPGVEPDDFAS